MAGARGFSLIELLLSIAIIAILTGLSLPIYASFQNRNDLDLKTEGIASTLRRAQTYARGVKNDDQWGVRVQSTAITLFKGSVFASRDTAYDEPVAIPTGMTVSGLTEVLFSKLSGAPNTTGTITLTTSASDSKVITINAKGMVSY